MTPFQDFIVAFQRSVKASQMYGPLHPRNLEFMQGLGLAYAGLLKGRKELQLATRNGRLFVDKVQEDAGNLQVGALAKALEDRAIHALLLSPGATSEELQALLQTLSLKPAELREVGGGRKFLEAQGVTHIKILATRLEEVTEAGEVVASLLESMASVGGVRDSQGGLAQPRGSGRFSQGGDGGGTEPRPVPMRRTMVEAPQGQPLPTLVEQLQGFFVAMAGVGQGAADLSQLGDFMEGQGLDRQGAQPTTQGVLNQAISGLAAGPRLGVMLGAAALRSGPLRNTFGRMTGTLGATSLAQAYMGGTITLPELGANSDKLQAMSPSPQRWGDQLAQALMREGMSEDQLKDLVDVLTWDSQTHETKLSKLLQGQRIFEIPPEKVLAFLRELLEGGRITEFLRLVRHYSSGLAAPAVTRRKQVGEAFIAITDWVDIPGMPLGVIQELEPILNQAWGREKDPEVHATISRAFEHLLWHWVQQGDPRRTINLFEDLQDTATEFTSPAAWKPAAARDLLARLGSPERVNLILDQLYSLDRQGTQEQVLPYIQMLGAQGVNLLVERLAHEGDRTRRSRLLEALKACGQVSEAPLLASLQSPDWFVVRNALIVLAEVAGPERAAEVQACLTHPDTRVQRAAIRAVGRLGGRSPENALLPLLFQQDPEIQIEVLFTLSELNSKNAVPGLVQFLKSLKGNENPAQEKVRAKTVEVLGLLKSPTAIPVMEELLSRRRRFFSAGREPLPIRLAALRALLALDTREAQGIISKVLAAEPQGAELNALQQTLTDFLSASRPSPAVGTPSP